MMDWTNGRVAATVLAYAVVAGYGGSAWQRQEDVSAMHLAQWRGYDAGLDAGLRQGNEAKNQAFDEGYADGRSVAESSLDDAYDEGYTDGQADAEDTYQSEVGQAAPLYDAPSTDGGSTYYANCSEAEAAGAAPVHRGDPGYAAHLDRDGDGTGCE